MDGADWAAAFARREPERAPPDALVLPHWDGAQWGALLRFTAPRSFRASEVVIQRAAADRTLYLVAAGSLEVGVTHVDGVSMTPLARIGAGSILGEQSFFDGQPRSANVWAVTDGTLLLLPFEDFTRFGEAEPALARDFLFAMARVLSVRLRNTSFRVRR
ncbi:MAG: cyclic nucleotide-binding domain-containing protein [Burkholderiales bacterium]|jgi:CRP-like cAMP-binding protein|nr:cyclic nucleotide-binding domain-containing protein [Burkholderiales bacterium]